jgi:hypothetical protein
MMAKIMNNAVEQPQPRTPSRSLDTHPPQASLSLICDTPEDPKDAGQSDPTPGKAMSLSQADREEVGLESPPLLASKEQLLRDSEKRSKSNHDRPSWRLMLEATLVADAAVVDQNSPASNLGLHQAPAISCHPTVRHLLLEDSPIPALGAAVARAPRSKAIPAHSERKECPGQGPHGRPRLGAYHSPHRRQERHEQTSGGEGCINFCIATDPRYVSSS